MLRVRNFVPAISLEGFEEANDSRRGDGIYGKGGNVSLPKIQAGLYRRQIFQLYNASFGKTISQISVLYF